jgi:hypothetical protein
VDWKSEIWWGTVDGEEAARGEEREGEAEKEEGRLRF